MSIKPRDPLLGFAKGLTWFFIGILGFAAGMLTICSPFIFLKKAEILAQLAEKGVTVGDSFVAILFLVLVSIAGLLALMIWFLRLLQKIIDSVGEGDPFIPENADRLSRMGWITVAGYVASVPIGATIGYVAKIAADAGESVDAEVNMGGGGILLILVLFVLARVFRHGSAMRADLEGTV